jgi:hypothetical protein
MTNSLPPLLLNYTPPWRALVIVLIHTYASLFQKLPQGVLKQNAFEKGFACKINNLHQKERYFLNKGCKVADLAVLSGVFL